jgi:hypothetical protein
MITLHDLNIAKEWLLHSESEGTRIVNAISLNFVI